MLVARSARGGIAGHYSGHPLRTRCVLADAGGTVRAVFPWSVERLRRVARLPVLFSRRCESGRLAGLPAVCLTRAPVVSAGMLLERSPLATAPVGSAGVVLGSTRWALPDDSHGGEAMSGSQIPASVCPEGELLARTVAAPRTRGKRLSGSVPLALCDQAASKATRYSVGGLDRRGRQPRDAELLAGVLELGHELAAAVHMDGQQRETAACREGPSGCACQDGGEEPPCRHDHHRDARRSPAVRRGSRRALPARSGLERRIRPARACARGAGGRPGALEASLGRLLR